MKLQNVSAQSRLVGDGGLRKLMRRGTNADLGDIGPQKQGSMLYHSNSPRVKEESINIIDQKGQLSGPKQKNPYLRHQESLADSQDPQRASVEALSVNQLIGQLQLSGTHQKKVQIVDQPSHGHQDAQPAFGPANTDPTDLELYQMFRESEQNLEMQQQQINSMQGAKQGPQHPQHEDQHLHQSNEDVRREGK